MAVRPDVAAAQIAYNNFVRTGQTSPGPQGPQGNTGPQGTQGAQGNPGTPGENAIPPFDPPWNEPFYAASTPWE